MKQLTVIHKIRLVRLFEGMMFWYGIEQLFMDNIIGDPTARVWAISGFTASVLLFDLFGGIFADKFGRKQAMLVGVVIQVLAIFILAFSTRAILYAIGSFLWGMYWSFMNGSVQAYLYDYMKEKGKTAGYASAIGRSWAFTFIGATIANISSGFIADVTDLRVPYLLSLVPIALVGFVMTTLPSEKRQEHHERIWQHRALIFSTLQKPVVILFGLRRMIGSMLFLTVLEFGQKYLLSFGINTKQLGFLWALTAVVCMIALFYTHIAQNNHEGFSVLFAAMLIMFAANVHNVVGIVAFFVVYAFNELLATVTETEIQHETDSKIRATVLSAVSFIGYSAGTVIAWTYNHLVNTHDVVFAAQRYAFAFGIYLSILVTAVKLRSIYLTKRRLAS